MKVIYMLVLLAGTGPAMAQSDPQGRIDDTIRQMQRANAEQQRQYQVQQLIDLQRQQLELQQRQQYR